MTIQRSLEGSSCEVLWPRLRSWPRLGVAGRDRAQAQSAEQKEGKSSMKLGLVTYNLANDWDVPTIIDKCQTTGFQGVELRTTHAHGVEPNLSAEARREVRQRFEDSGITLWGLGSVCEFHSDDPAIVCQNVETCHAFVKLAADVGARGVKVRPNGLQEDKGVPVEKTLKQVGEALKDCGYAAAESGVEIWLEVHGHGTSHPPHIRTILDHCSHQAVGACWNSKMTDLKEGSIKEYFDLLAEDIKSVHITDLWNEDYPWRELFSGLKHIGYDRFTLAEVGITPEIDREDYLRRYRARWMELCQ